MIVTGSNIDSGDLKYCPKCGSPLESGVKGSYPDEYKECSKCCGKLYLGLDGRDW
jgi:hypothetical protein